MNSKHLIKLALAAILLTLVDLVFDWLFGSIANLTYYSWTTVSNLLIILCLGYFILNSTQTGISLSLTSFIIYFGVGYFNTLIEAYIYNIMSGSETIISMIRGLLLTLIISPVLVQILGKWNKNEKEKQKARKRSVFGWIWRILLGDLLYFVFAAIAGFTLYALYPEFMEFYNDKMPPFILIIQTNLLIRGFVFVGIAILILKTLNLLSTKKTILIGLIFSIIGGIAPLIPPTEFMPGYVRLAHGFEVGISNFLYGVVLGYLLEQKNEKGTAPSNVQL